MRKYIFLLLFLISFNHISAQNKTLILDGTYLGKNLYVYNPFANEAVYCIKEVYINGKKSNAIVTLTAFTIDFPKEGIALNTKVHIEFIHDESCTPNIFDKDAINPNKVIPSSVSTIGKKSVSASFNGDGKKEVTNQQKFDIQTDFIKFIHYSGEKDKHIIDYKNLKELYLSKQINLLTKGIPNGFWVITNTNHKFSFILEYKAKKWLDSLSLVFARQHKFELVKEKNHFTNVTKKDAKGNISKIKLKESYSVDFDNQKINEGYDFPDRSFTPDDYRLATPLTTDTILSSGYYWNGLKIGVWTSYSKNGRIKSKILYVLGKPKGMAMMFYDDGSIAEQGQWENNRWQGTYQLFSKSGELQSQISFNSGGLSEGFVRKYHKNGLIESISVRKNGLEQGYTISFDSTAKLIKTAFCLYGVCKDTILKDTSEIEMLLAFARQENQTIFKKKLLFSTQKDLQAEEKQKRYLLGGIALAFLFVISLIWFLLRIKKSNQIIQQQKKEVELKNNLVEEKQKEILDSIHYAKRIQRALITNENYIDKHLKRLMKK